VSQSSSGTHSVGTVCPVSGHYLGPMTSFSSIFPLEIIVRQLQFIIMERPL
jgi:hypothetical protein